jgi:3-O-methylgallate 3,4-dioxygenase
MAELVLGIGTSHSPALNSSAADYPHHADRDIARTAHLDRDGNVCSYDDLLTLAPKTIANEITDEAFARRVAACEAGLARLTQEIEDAALDTLIIVGDDQYEQYKSDNMPAMLIYGGETLWNNVLPLPASAPEYWKRARAQFHEPDEPKTYPVDAPLARHLVDVLMAFEFDIGYSTSLANPHGEGHAFGFVHRRLLDGAILPIVPVVLNTYFPPNQPRPARCYALGQAIAKAVESWPGNARIGILASGGLSHFTVDETLDRGLLAAMQTKDTDALRTVPLHKLNSGNSEIRNWITVAGALETLPMAWHDYQPCYRSLAATGCGMAFAVWKQG